MFADICPCCQSPMVHNALVWLCPGIASAVLMPYEKGRAGLSRKKIFFQATSLSLETLSAVSEVLSSRFMNDTVSVLSYQVGI